MDKDGKSGKPMLVFIANTGLIWNADLRQATIENGVLVEGQIFGGDMCASHEDLKIIIGDNTLVYDLHTANQAVREDLRRNTNIPIGLINEHSPEINLAVHAAVNHFRPEWVAKKAEEQAEAA